MLKVRRKDKTYLVSQVDHGAISGYLAAHWGNDQFACPGAFGSDWTTDSLRSETILAIAQHDNGWWEWEAMPALSEVDGFPQDLTELLGHQEEAMNRWRLGVPRLAQHHPYASLLISYHAYWLYAHSTQQHADPAFLHPLFWQRTPEPLRTTTQRSRRNFLREMELVQQQLIDRLRRKASQPCWVEVDHLKPHVRLLQLLDGFSLSLCGAVLPIPGGWSRGLGEDAFELLDVPRRSWEDRVTIKVSPLGNGHLKCHPYPFDADPLPVSVPTRICNTPPPSPEAFGIWWHQQPIERLCFHYTS